MNDWLLNRDYVIYASCYFKLLMSRYTSSVVADELNFKSFDLACQLFSSKFIYLILISVSTHVDTV